MTNPDVQTTADTQAAPATDTQPVTTAETQPVTEPTTTTMVTSAPAPAPTTTSTEDWSEPDETTGARYRTAPAYNKQVRVYVLTRDGRSANVAAQSEEAGRKVLENFVAGK